MKSLKKELLHVGTALSVLSSPSPVLSEPSVYGNFYANTIKEISLSDKISRDILYLIGFSGRRIDSSGAYASLIINDIKKNISCKFTAIIPPTTGEMKTSASCNNSFSYHDLDDDGVPDEVISKRGTLLRSSAMNNITISDQRAFFRILDSMALQMKELVKRGNAPKEMSVYSVNPSVQKYSF